MNLLPDCPLSAVTRYSMCRNHASLILHQITTASSKMNALVRAHPPEWPPNGLGQRVASHLGASLFPFLFASLSQCCACLLRLPRCLHLQHRTEHPWAPTCYSSVYHNNSNSRSHKHRASPSRSWSPHWLSIVFVLMLTSAQLASACGPGRRKGPRLPYRRQTPLVFKQHIPNVSENTLGASGLHEGRVTRNNAKFKELVPNYNPDIIFRDDEGTGADRLMTQRLKEKLNTLAISVMNQWPGVKLRVTQSWHEGNQYNHESLHYEGRAVDITTNDKDRSKLGMLARLAVEAGFDWVFYESRVWIHCSVKSEKSDSVGKGGCFDEKSIVYDRSGPRLIKDIQVGDEILSMGADGKFLFSPVLMFLDRDLKVDRLYYQLETETGTRITATPSHLLFVAEKKTPNTGLTLQEPQFAKDITVGQYLYVRNGTLQEARLERVVKISTSLGKGAYAPLTAAGNLVVNNITASCYALIRSQTLAHFSFLPVRWGHFFLQLGDNLSSFFLSKSTSTFSSRSHTRASVSVGPIGVHWYARALYGLFQYLIPSSLLFD